ncbi:MAG: dihydropteroate synthase [Acidibrevibacterium sp.]|jgi:dihydropteroate synthase|uniref:dihydropteroate synthase n=1 Tax=Acidibrevibacterium fodinaquatile TaxID=1969806 RepID=UPI0023A8582B|nr:dihydropteroate synthase [Acidibrevibacterium fodinaquatile]MCA7118088.1 dihydropteroate synthase [Acidibrevibacterium fodinaquatile]
MRLIEPLGLLDGEAAAAAVAERLALPLAGGRLAFTLARLIDESGARIVPVTAIPDEFAPLRARITAKPPPWAGLPTDRPAVMGILNVTPDSFSDGGRHFDHQAAIAAGQAMAEAGAAIIDVGGESTRPGAEAIAPGEEQRRVLPVIRALAARGILVSADTRHAATMAAALDAGAAIINDVSGLTHDPDALALVARRDCAVVMMHMRGAPATMKSLATYGNVACEVAAELGARLDAALAAGIAPARIALDPGFGFAKEGRQNLDLMRRLALFANFGCPLLVGVSRKRLVGMASGEGEASRRAPGSIAAGLYALAHGAFILRVHDVAETVQAVRVWDNLSESERVL